MKKRTVQSCISIAFIIFTFFAFLRDTPPDAYLNIPGWIIDDLCENQRIIALSNRVVTFRNGSLPTLSIDLLMSLISNFNYFREEPYLTVIDPKDNKIIFEQPNTLIKSIAISNDGLWGIYNTNNHIILQSLSDDIRKQIDESSAEFLDWSTNGDRILFVEGGNLLFSDLSSCLVNNQDNCHIEKITIPFYVNSFVDVQFARIIQNEKILIKMRGDDSEIISFSGEKIKEIPGKDYLAVDYLPSRKAFTFIGPQFIDIYSTDFVKLESINLPIKTNYRSARWSPNGDQIVFINNEASDLKFYFDNTSENSLRSSRLYLMDGLNSNSIRHIYERSDEEIYWISWLYGKRECKQ